MKKNGCLKMKTPMYHELLLLNTFTYPLIVESSVYHL